VINTKTENGNQKNFELVQGKNQTQFVTEEYSRRMSISHGQIIQNTVIGITHNYYS